MPSSWLPPHLLSTLLPALSYFRVSYFPVPLFTNNSLGLGLGGWCWRERAKWGCFLISSFIITKVLGLWVDKSRGGAVLAFQNPPFGQCSASSTWSWSGQGRPLPAPFRLRFEPLPPVSLYQSLRTPVITLNSFHCLPLTFFWLKSYPRAVNRSSASSWWLGLVTK